MDDVFLVRGLRSIANLLRILQRFIEGKRAFERRSLDVLHHQIVRTDIVEVAYVRVIQCCHGACLALETFAEAGVRRLDGDAAPQPRVVCPVDFAHAALADEAFNLVRTQAGAGFQLNRRGLGQQFCRWLIEQSHPRGRYLKQPLDFAPQLGIGAVQHSAPAFQSGVIERFDLLPPVMLPPVRGRGHVRPILTALAELRIIFPEWL